MAKALLKALRLAPLFAAALASASSTRPAPQACSRLLSGGFVTISGDFAVVQGSSGHGGLQPDYLISSEDPELASFLDRIARSGAAMPSMGLKERIGIVQQEVRAALRNRAPAHPVYRALLEEHRESGTPVMLGEYIEKGCGVCREYGLLTHLALRRVGIAAEFAYVQHTHMGRVEDHAVNVVAIDGVDTVIDCYYERYNLQPLATLWRPDAFLRLNSYPTVALPGGTPSAQPESWDFAMDLKRDPLGVFRELESRRQTAAATGDPLGFRFPEMAAAMGQALNELASHSQDPAGAAMGLGPRFLELAQRAQVIIAGGYVYRDVLAFSRDFAEAVEPLAAKKWVDVPGRWASTYFTRTYKSNFEEIALSDGEGFAFPWFGSVDMDFFIRTRPSLVYLLGMRSFVDYTDGDPLGSSDYYYHDIEHALRQKIQTDLILSGLTEPERRAVQDVWERRIRLLMTERDRLARQDAELGKAFTYLLFELMHERGFAPDFQSLRDQTLSDRWTTVIWRKLQHGFWFREPQASPSFDVLEAARRRLHEYCGQQAAAEMDGTRLRLQRGESAAIEATVRIQVPAQAYKGVVAAVELEDVDRIFAALKLDGRGRLRRFPESQVNLEQVRFSHRVVSPENLGLFAKALALRQAGRLRVVRADAVTGLPVVQGPDRQWRAFDAAAAAELDFSDITVTPISSHHAYRLEQLLGLVREGGVTDALALKPSRLLRGTLERARGGVGAFSLTLTTTTDGRVRFRPQDALVLTR